MVYMALTGKTNRSTGRAALEPGPAIPCRTGSLTAVRGGGDHVGERVSKAGGAQVARSIHSSGHRRFCVGPARHYGLPNLGDSILGVFIRAQRLGQLLQRWRLSGK